MSDVQSVSIVHEHVSCELVLTNFCNLACSYCIARDLPGPPMTMEIGRSAIDLFVYLAEGGKSIEFVFTGGEPLTEFRVLEQLTAYARDGAGRAGMDSYFVLKTNGSILNQKVIDFLQQNSVKVVVSIDGMPSVHDKHRMTKSGKETHSLVRHNLKTLLWNGISCVASVTVHPDSTQLLLKNVCYLKGLGVAEMDVGPAYGTVTWTESQCLCLSRSLIDVAEYVRCSVNNGHQIAVEPLRRESEHVGGILANSWGCYAGSRNLAFLPNGQVTGCSALAMLVSRHPSLLIGDVFDGLDQPAIDHLVKLAQATDEDRPRCRGCEVAINCTGGCLAINYSTTGSPHMPPDVYCKTISTIPEALYRAWSSS